MRVRFTRDEEVRDHLDQVVASFAADEVVDLSTPSARRWIRRGAAVAVDGDAGVEVRPTESKVEVEKTDAFEKYREKELAVHGESQETGNDTPPSASQADQASASETSNTSDEPESGTDAESSSSTGDTSEPDGQTSSTGRTPRGGAKRKTRRGSKGKKSA